MEDVEQLTSGSNHRGGAGMGPQVHILYLFSPPSTKCVLHTGAGPGLLLRPQIEPH